MKPWTPQEVETVKALYLAGEPTVEIAKAVPNRTLKAINRQMAKYGIRRSPEVIVTNARAAQRQRTYPGKTPVDQCPPPRWKPKPEAWAALPGSTPRPLLCIPANGCKWPVGEDDNNQLFCCEPRNVGDRSYCALHRARSTRAA